MKRQRGPRWLVKSCDMTSFLYYCPASRPTSNFPATVPHARSTTSDSHGNNNCFGVSACRSSSWWRHHDRSAANGQRRQVKSQLRGCWGWSGRSDWPARRPARLRNAKPAQLHCPRSWGTPQLSRRRTEDWLEPPGSLKGLKGDRDYDGCHSSTARISGDSSIWNHEARTDGGWKVNRADSDSTKKMRIIVTCVH